MIKVKHLMMIKTNSKTKINMFLDTTERKSTKQKEKMKPEPQILIQTENLTFHLENKNIIIFENWYFVLFVILKIVLFLKLDNENDIL